VWRTCSPQRTGQKDIAFRALLLGREIKSREVEVVHVRALESMTSLCHDRWDVQRFPSPSDFKHKPQGISLLRVSTLLRASVSLEYEFIPQWYLLLRICNGGELNAGVGRAEYGRSKNAQAYHRISGALHLKVGWSAAVMRQASAQEAQLYEPTRLANDHIFND